MPPLDARRPGIDVEETECFVVLHFQDVRVSADEELRRRGVERGANAGVVVARIAADVLDEHVHVLALEAVQLAIHQPKVAAVAVAADGTQRPERSQPLGHLDGADVAGVPDFVAGLEIVQVFLVPIAVGVAEDADFLHFFIVSDVSHFSRTSVPSYLRASEN